MERKKTTVKVKLSFEFDRTSTLNDAAYIREFIADMFDESSPDGEIRVYEQEGSDEMEVKLQTGNHGGKSFYTDSLGDFINKYSNFISHHDVCKVLLAYGRFIKCETSTTTETVKDNDNPDE